MSQDVLQKRPPLWANVHPLRKATAEKVTAIVSFMTGY